MKLFKNRKVLIWFVVLLVAALLVFGVLHGQNYFRRRNVRYLQRFIDSFGIWAPVVVVLLILISTIIPPLPLPVPLIEIAAGLAFGFWEGAILIWLSQIFSSLSAFGVSRYFGKRILSVLNSHIFNLYRQYLNRRGPVAVFLIRMAMAAPFNVISYLSGMTQMKIFSFTIATALGVIPEVVLFTFLGSQLRNIHLNLGHVIILIIGVGVIGSALAFLTMRFLMPKIMSSD